MQKTSVGLYGNGGHQITNHLVDHPGAALVAAAGFEDAELPEGVEGVRRHDDLDSLLADEGVELVSLCSPMRSEQAADAIACMQAGKHVYAEKPCAMTEADLDAIIDAAGRTGMQFHEMAGTLVEQPYMAVRKAVASGAIGKVVQVLAQKSYPWHDRRPADENVDGGLAMQVGVYVTRFVEHVAGQRIASLSIQETQLGNDMPDSDCRRAVSFLMTLEGGGVGSGVCNYLNALKEQIWGYEILRIFGTEGIVESTSEGHYARLIRNGEASEELDLSEPSGNYFDMFVAALQGGKPMPMTIEEETSPTRWVIKGKQQIPRHVHT